jgi:hypothetical protein
MAPRADDPGMTRDTLQTILRAAGNLQEKSGTFKASAEQRLTIYLGNDGRGLAVAQVEELRLEDAFVVLKPKDAGQVFADYAAIYAVSVQPPKENAPKKAGFA